MGDISRLTKMRLLSVLFLFFSALFVCGQKIDNTTSYRDIASDKYFRFNYDNDLFAGQDKNYTQGYSFEFVAPFILKNPINKLFLSLGNDVRKAGIVFEHIGFTPGRYEKVEIQEEDRPFASVAMLKSFSTSTGIGSRQRLSSHFSFGVMGPAAIGKEIQTVIHSVTGGRVPLGWKNQIENQIVLNYGIDYEKELLRLHDNFGFYANTSVKVGNLYSNASLGFNSTFGIINDPYASNNTQKVRLYGYIQPLISLVGYDGTLQDRIIRDRSVYTIPTEEITRVVGQVFYGIVLQTKLLYIEYYRAYITKEIDTLGSAAWGGIKIGFHL
ncbi:MAG: lipid A 3-O-deacylase [Saprospiraceae bacterium]|jgi:lipid A 3-O-deacylase